MLEVYNQQNNCYLKVVKYKCRYRCNSVMNDVAKQIFRLNE